MSTARPKGPKAPVLHLVPRPPERRALDVDRDTVQCLVQLLEKAANGEVIGLAFAAQLRDRAYIVDAVGAAHDSPTYARGMLAALDDKLSARIGVCE